MRILHSLRGRIALFVSIAVFVSLLLLNLSVTSFVRKAGDGRVTRRLQAAGTTLLSFVRAEHAEHPEEGWQAAAAHALDEWPTGADAYAIRTATGELLGARGNPALIRRMWSADSAVGPPQRDIFGARLLMVRDTLLPTLSVVAIGSLDAEREESAVLTRWLLWSIPVMTVASLSLGYLLARRALQPVNDLAISISALDVERTDLRLVAPDGASEIIVLRDRFNALLDRLSQSRHRTQRFVREAAHQIRTPLTLVLGEAGLQCAARDISPEAKRASERILRAAQQMQRRVDDLVLLAIADVGEQPRCADEVDLESVVLEVADLLHTRAVSLGRAIVLDRIEHVMARGDEALLRELLLELLENACRHGSADSPIRITLTVLLGEAQISVQSAGGPFSLPSEAADTLVRSGHLGLPLVQWITRLHRGRLTLSHQNGENLLTLLLPLA